MSLFSPVVLSTKSKACTSVIEKEGWRSRKENLLKSHFFLLFNFFSISHSHENSVGLR